MSDEAWRAPLAVKADDEATPPAGDGNGAPDDDAPGPEAHASAGLVLISTPIGNLGDVSARAARALEAADLVLCEDTRTTARLLARLGIRARTEPLHEHNESARVPALLDRLAAGARIALVSDAGTPLVSDPGYRLVRAAIAAGVAVTAIPGANAAVNALVLSGLPPHPFLFLGFAAPRQAARLEAFARLRAAETAGLSATLIWYEAPHRVAEMLEDLARVFGDRPAALAREMTKRFEEVRRGGLEALVRSVASDPPRGEIVVLVGPPAAEDGEAEARTLDAQLRAALARMSVKDAAAMVATASGVARRTVYARALALSREADPPHAPPAAGRLDPPVS